ALRQVPEKQDKKKLIFIPSQQKKNSYTRPLLKKFTKDEIRPD
ncbi:22662_t:CDS:1, partial [Gigaspora rosea]